MSTLSCDTKAPIETKASSSQPICKQEDGTRINQHHDNTRQKNKAIEIIVIDSSDSSDDEDNNSGGNHHTILQQLPVVEQRDAIRCTTDTDILESDLDSDDSAVDTFFPERQKQSKSNSTEESQSYHHAQKHSKSDSIEEAQSHHHDEFCLDRVFVENDIIEKSMDELRSIIIQQMDYGKQQHAKGSEPLQYLKLLNKAKVAFGDFKDGFLEAYDEIQCNELEEESL